MKTLKKGWKQFAFKVVPKVFNILVILGLIFQPVGPAGVYSIAWAIESDATAAVTTDEPEEKSAPEPEAAPEEKSAPVVEEKEATPVAEEAALEVVSAESVAVPETEAAPVVEEESSETLPATEEVAPVIEEAVPAAESVETPVEGEATPAVSEDVSVIVPETAPSTPEAAPIDDDTSGQVCLSDDADLKTSTAADWSVDEKSGKAETKEKVSLGVTYVFPVDQDVRVTFTCLPKAESARAPLSIERIQAADIDLPAGVSVAGEYAYDITTKGMDNGDFVYDLVLPKADDIDDANVVYVEKSADEMKSADISESDLKEVDKNDVKSKAGSLEAEGLDHFTTFFIATYSSTSFSVEKSSYYQGETVYVKASGFNTNEFYRIAVNPPGNNNSVYITSCFNPSSSNDTLTGTYSLSSNAATGNNTWTAELKEFDYADCHDSDIPERVEDSFSVVAPPYTPTRICHATGSGNNPFTSNTPNTAGVLMGHVGQSHQDAEDIIPPVPYYLPAGQNWASGQAIWNNDCQATGGLRVIKTVDDQSDLTQWSFRLDTAGPIVQANASGVADFGPVSAGQHTITEIGLASYGVTSVSGLGCVAVPNTASAMATVTNGNTTECVFNNAVRRGSITIEKDAQPNDAQDFSFSSQSFGNFSLDDDADPMLPNAKTVNNLLPGEYAITENTVAGWSLQGISCTGNNRSFRTDGSSTQVIALAPGENVRCIYTNVKDAYCGDGIVNQETEQCDGTAGIPSPSFVCSQSCRLDLVEPKIGICHATDSQSNPYNFEQPNKSADVSGHDGHDGVVWSYGVAAHSWGDIIPPFEYIGGSYPGQNWTAEGRAIWNNQCAVPFGLVKANKYTDANGDGDYADQGEGMNSSASNMFKWTLDGTGSNVFGATVNAVAVGTHTVNETGPTGYHLAGWYPTGSTQYSCAYPKGTVLPVDVTVVGGQTTSITLCNARDTGKITIVKDAIDNDSQDFNFTTTGGLGSFTLDDDGSNSTQQGGRSNTKVFAMVGTGTYTVTEALTNGWQLTDLVCTSNQEEKGVDVDTTVSRTATIDLALGEEVLCTFTNTELGTIEGVKFNDKDGDGRRDEHEGRLNGWTIYLDLDKDGVHDENEPGDVTNGHFLIFALGAYAFDGLLPGTYQVCEEMQAGWYNSTPVCQEVVLTPGKKAVVDFGNHQAVKVVASKIVCADESELPNWGAYGGPNVTAYTAENWVRTHRSCQLVPDWDFQWSYDNVPNPGDNNASDPISDWTTFGPTNASGVAETMIADLKGDQKVWVRELPQAGYLPFTGASNMNPVSAEMYCHTDVINYDNWEWIGDPQYSETYHCVAWNVELGSIDGEKWNDLNGNGERDCIASEETNDERQACEYEPLLSGWTIYLDLNNDGDRDENEPSDVTGADGAYSFTGLTPRHYVVREEMQQGWQQTATLCGVKEEESEENQDARFFRPEPKPKEGVEVKPGETVSCLIGNTETPSLSIEKWNDSVGVEQPGNTVRYHIRVTAHDNDVNDVQVTDLPPAGFAYVSGSAVADQGGLAHVYASPGVWDLGDMTAGQSIELAYDTTIAGTQDPGDYKDLAYARGTSEAEADVLADDLLDADNFVGTNVEVALAETPATIVIPEDNEHKIKEKTVRKTQVLGASTVLPMTGANTGFLALALAALLGGIALLVLSRRSRKSFITSEAMLKSLAFIIVSAVFLTLGSVVQAAESGLVSAQIETPAAVTTTPDFKIGFVALDIASPARTLEVRCFKDSDATAFATYTLAAGGSSGDCQVSAAVMPVDGDYTFFVKVVTTSGAAETVTSGTVPVKLVSTVPGTPYDYDRNDASCMNHITFTTASDAGKTVKVELYRSLATTFAADAATKVAEQAISSGTSGSFSVAAPDCSNDSFYALRAVDAYGHGSAFVGDADRDVDTDTVTHTKTKTVEGSSTSQGAIPVTGAGAVGGGEVEGAETTADEAGEAGSVLGESVEAEDDADGQGGFMSMHPWLSGFGALILLVLGYILYTRKQHDEEQH